MLNLLFPKVCSACSELLNHGASVLCASCRHNVPTALFHKTGDKRMHHIFYGRLPIEEATALLLFQKKGISQQLLHNLKYRGRKEVGTFLGTWLGAELSEYQAYKTIDLVIPVPLHLKKERQRGYNQVTGFGKELAKALDVPFRDDLLLKVSKTRSQVFKGRWKRFESESSYHIT